VGRAVGSVAIWSFKLLLLGVIAVLSGCVSSRPVTPTTPPAEGPSQPGDEPPSSDDPPTTPDVAPAPDDQPTVTDALPDLHEPPAVTDSLPDLHETPAVTRTLPDLPPPRVVPPAPLRATAEQMERIREYYGLRATSSLRLDVSVDAFFGEPVAAGRYILNGIRSGDVAPTESGETARESRSVLQVEVSGDMIPSTEHFYGRAVVRMTYRTGPGKRLQSNTTVRGPYRLSQVSATDAALRSLRAIPDSVYRDVLTWLDERWITGVELNGLPYRIDGYSQEGACDTGPIFETPPRVWYHLVQFLPDSRCRYTIDPLTGTIRIVYNGDR
jgi:hypothetical protein